MNPDLDRYLAELLAEGFITEVLSPPFEDDGCEVWDFTGGADSLFGDREIRSMTLTMLSASCAQPSRRPATRASSRC